MKTITTLICTLTLVACGKQEQERTETKLTPESLTAEVEQVEDFGLIRKSGKKYVEVSGEHNIPAADCLLKTNPFPSGNMLAVHVRCASPFQDVKKVLYADRQSLDKWLSPFAGQVEEQIISDFYKSFESSIKFGQMTKGKKVRLMYRSHGEGNFSSHSSIIKNGTYSIPKTITIMRSSVRRTAQSRR